MSSSRRTAALLALVLGLAPAVARAQCTNLPASAPEAKLLAFYALPIAFNRSAQPDQLRAGQWRLSFEMTPMPGADSARRSTTCYASSKQESTNLASLFPRPRLEVGLPWDLEAEVSYVPPLQVKDAKANLLGLGLSWTRRVAIVAGTSVIAEARVHTVIGKVEGPITCNIDALQANAANPCYGRQISNDAFSPNVSGAELTGAVDLGDYAVYLTGGVNSINSQLKVDFQPGAGYITPLPPRDRSLVSLASPINRFVLGGGATWRMFRGLDLTAQIYASPDDNVSVSRILLTYTRR
ncbi:MAG: hypothetical protein HY275_00070 [Gemmatimonadetes bacterium]|nr:hypothetical protein [Gemmatimonadota bacterium]